jgi:hypothetical protein
VDLLDGGAGVGDLAIGVQQHDGVGVMLDEGAEAPVLTLHLG